VRETNPPKIGRVKTGVPKGFDRRKYDVFWTAGASVWLEQLEIRRELRSAVPSIPKCK
jgi:hypothetical protein